MRRQFDYETGHCIGQIVKASIMLGVGCGIILPGALLGGGLPVMAFAVLWIGCLVVVIVRNVIRLVKHKQDALEDTNLYYAQEDTEITTEQRGSMTTCPYCGAAVPEVFDYCNHCGRKQC